MKIDLSEMREFAHYCGATPSATQAILKLCNYADELLVRIKNLELGKHNMFTLNRELKGSIEKLTDKLKDLKENKNET